MTYQELVNKFLEMIQKIKSLNPAYKQPGDGSDGTCDCIGLIIGAVRRMGLKWTGIHGSNWAARYETVGLSYIASLSELELGDAVYKGVDQHGRGRKPCNNGQFTHSYDLPDRYKQGHPCYSGDLNDYYHVGVVTHLNPLQITHMTSPRMKVDTSIGNWNYHGKVKPIVDAAQKGSVPLNPAPSSPVANPPSTVPETGKTAVVVAENGKPVKMREYPSTSCRTWENLPCGTRVTIIEPGEEWCRIDGGHHKGWYMMSKFLDIVGDGKGTY